MNIQVVLLLEQDAITRTLLGPAVLRFLAERFS
jgi:hypothetical protein